MQVLYTGSTAAHSWWPSSFHTALTCSLLHPPSAGPLPICHCSGSMQHIYAWPRHVLHGLLELMNGAGNHSLVSTNNLINKTPGV